MKSRKPLSIREAWQTRPVDLPGDRRQRVLRAFLDNLVMLVFTPRSWFWWQSRR